MLQLITQFSTFSPSCLHDTYTKGYTPYVPSIQFAFIIIVVLCRLMYVFIYPDFPNQNIGT